MTSICMIPVSVHEKNLRAMRCIVSRMMPITLHHCHGGSMKSLGWHVGMAQRQNPFLQIPLHLMYHTGNFGIDSGMGVRTWEKSFGYQVDLLGQTNAQLPYDIWSQARQWEGVHRGNTVTKRFDSRTESRSTVRRNIDVGSN